MNILGKITKPYKASNFSKPRPGSLNAKGMKMPKQMKQVGKMDGWNEAMHRGYHKVAMPK